MSDKRARTPWFSGKQKPLRPGWYEWKCPEWFDNTPRLRMYNGGEFWGPGKWIDGSNATLSTMCASCVWRGLTKPAGKK